MKIKYLRQDKKGALASRRHFYEVTETQFSDGEYFVCEDGSVFKVEHGIVCPVSKPFRDQFFDKWLKEAED